MTTTQGKMCEQHKTCARKQVQDNKPT
jgi:hypothetical protein